MIKSIDSCYLHIKNIYIHIYTWGFPGGPSGKEATCQYRRHKRQEFNPLVEMIPWRRAWQSTPIFLFLLENSMDRGDWQATVHRVAKSLTRLKRLSVHAQVVRLKYTSSLSTQEIRVSYDHPMNIITIFKLMTNSVKCDHILQPIT